MTADEVRAAYNMEHAMDNVTEQEREKEINETLATNQFKAQAAGLSDKLPLLTSIPLEHWITPVLHIKLGLTVATLNLLLDYIHKHLENFPLPAREAIAEHQESLVNLNTASATLFDAEQALDVKKMKSMVTEYGKHDKTVKKKTATEEDKEVARRRMVEINIYFNEEVGMIGDDAVDAIKEDDGYLVARKNEIAALLLSKKSMEEIEKKKKSAMKELLSDFQNRPVEHLVEQVLAKYGVQRQVFHSHSLIGEHCHRLLRDNASILQDITVVMKDTTIRKTDVNEGTDAEIDNLVGDLADLMGALDLVFSFASRQEPPLSDNECDTFSYLCSYIGHLWRRMLTTVPPKLHLLETHMPIQASYFRILGMFTEDPIERMHNIDNKYNRIFNNLKTFIRAEKAKHVRSSLEHASQVIELTEKCLTKSKRVRGEASQKKKEDVEEGKRARKEENIAKVLDKANMSYTYKTP
jgi:hypothetical protein